MNFNAMIGEALYENSEQWANALADWVDRNGGDSSPLRVEGKIPSPREVCDCLNDVVDFNCELASNKELEECCIAIRDMGWFADPSFRLAELRRERRPSPRDLALKALNSLKKVHNMDPEAVKTIELALTSPGELHDGGRG